MKKFVPITFNYGKSIEDIIGTLNLNTEGVNPKADLAWKLYQQNPDKWSIVPSYIEHADGSKELLEVSLVMNREALQTKPVAPSSKS